VGRHRIIPPSGEPQVEAFLDPPVPLLRHFPRAAQRFFANLGINRLHNHCAGFNRVAKTLGVEGVPSYAALLLGDLTLVTDTPDVLGISAEAMAAWRPRAPGYRATTRLRYAGPLFAHLETPLPELWRDDRRFVYSRGWSRDLLAGACATCRIATTCRSGCLGMAFRSSGAVGCQPLCLHADQWQLPQSS
jgi:radical SAM protein with 4Fe4S-binding SPASM domain